MNADSWWKISELFQRVAQELKAEWKVLLPPTDSRPAAADEEECDAWCVRLAANLREPTKVNPPDHVKPWILARLVSFSTTARVLAKKPGTPVPELTPSIVEQFLIGEWHGHGKHLWPHVKASIFERS
jgi:hypothetical protein